MPSFFGVFIRQTLCLDTFRSGVGRVQYNFSMTNAYRVFMSVVASYYSNIVRSFSFCVLVNLSYSYVKFGEHHRGFQPLDLHAFVTE